MTEQEIRSTTLNRVLYDLKRVADDYRNAGLPSHANGISIAVSELVETAERLIVSEGEHRADGGKND